MGKYRFEIDIAAPREQVFERWIDVERSSEWIEGMSRVSEISGPLDKAGTSYKVHFGSWSTSLTTILEAERPRWLRTKFGTWLLRGEQTAQFDEIPTGTRLTQTFVTNGVIPAIMARIFASGSYKGSFRGELESFRRICEIEAHAPG